MDNSFEQRINKLHRYEIIFRNSLQSYYVLSYHREHKWRNVPIDEYRKLHKEDDRLADKLLKKYKKLEHELI